MWIFQMRFQVSVREVYKFWSVSLIGIESATILQVCLFRMNICFSNIMTSVSVSSAGML